ncbi:zinc finger protein 726-like isoform X2 [Maniola jurtina]|uniref:zinc finger protein 726-like isoform X2 n=1 Tax=Maniola jurtina TaxID=191418 RepID=UPI001E686EAA|nr:zinc finger protein 726-like isoform X2 [Maniola jurtina]
MTSTAVNSNSEIKCSQKDDEALGVKKETEVIVKQEIVECLVCLGRSGNYYELNSTATAGGTPLSDFLNKFTHAGLNKAPNGSKCVCKTCLNLVNILEQTELEYYKAREEFHAVISKNPLFEASVTSTNERVTLEVVKNEDLGEVYVNNDCDDDSEDEPLALTKKKRHRKVDKRKKKPATENKRKLRNKDNADSAWECTECVESGECGGEAALTAHMLVAHLNMQKVKKEESPDRSQSPNMNCLEEMLKLEAGTFDDDDDDSSIYAPEPISNGKQRSRPLGRPKKKTFKSIPGKKKDPKVMHQCDQCNARYTSIVRLEQHKLKHDDSKPPYICEVCGAHYKHKRACDIHVALHKGISDWKCEECNKLFPSKGALQRHNNIHTGKLNYQCDLCGKSFIHTSSFKMHKLSHSGVKPHSCDVCGLALMTRSHLKRHKRVHSGEKRHECAVCGKRFSERYNLVAHARAHQGAPDAAHAALPRRRLFRCAFCPERFERRYMLERHAGAAHGRALERPPPTPRNTMSKLLKAQAQRRDHDSVAADGDSKLNRSPESRAASGSKLQVALSAEGSAGGDGAAGAVSAITWAGAYAAEFGLRPDYSH